MNLTLSFPARVYVYKIALTVKSLYKGRIGEKKFGPCRELVAFRVFFYYCHQFGSHKVGCC